MARILVVDDEEAVRGIVAELLRALGHEVETAAGGLEAISILEAGRYFDAVFTDRQMPMVRGEEVLRAAKKLLPAAKLILMTGDALSEADIRVIFSAGADEILSKPFTADDISVVLVRHFP